MDCAMSGEIARLQPMWHTLADFVVGSLLAPRVFSGLSSFLFVTKANTVNSYSTMIVDLHENHLELGCGFLSIYCN